MLINLKLSFFDYLNGEVLRYFSFFLFHINFELYIYVHKIH